MEQTLKQKFKAKSKNFSYILGAIGRDFIQGTLPLRATSLVYTTILSFVPLLALSFSVLKSLKCLFLASLSNVQQNVQFLSHP